MGTIVTLDIENMALRGWAWGLYEQNILNIDHNQHLLCVAYKYLNKKTVHTAAIWDYPLYKKDPHSDKMLALHIWKVLDGADIVIGHNIKQFDVKMINAMFMRHGMSPPSHYRVVDTIQETKKYGRFPSNKLDDLGTEFGIGNKLKHEGFSLWLGVDSGDEKSQRKMVRYNAQDVRLNEKLYLWLRPWMATHPNLANIIGRPEACPRCGAVGTLTAQGTKSTQTTTYQQYRCSECGGWCRGRIADKLTPKPAYV